MAYVMANRKEKHQDIVHSTTVHSAYSSISKLYHIIWTIENADRFENRDSHCSQVFPANRTRLTQQTNERFYLKMEKRNYSKNYYLSVYKYGKEDVIIKGPLLLVYTPMVLFHVGDEVLAAEFDDAGYVEIDVPRHLEMINKEGVLKMECVLRGGDAQCQDMSRTEIESKLDLARDLESLWESTDYSDLEVSSKDGKRFKVHRNILAARCPYFKKVLASSAPGVIDLPYDSWTTRGLLRSIYSGRTFPLFLDTQADSAADYALPRLQKMDDDHLKEITNEDNVLVFLVAAVCHDFPDLEEASLQYIKGNNLTKTVTQSPDWTSLDDHLKMTVLTKLTQL